MRVKLREKSFTLVETMVAIGLLVVFMAEVLNVQGNAAYFTQYSRNITRATYLGKRVMDQVEYYWTHKNFKEMKYEAGDKDLPFEDDPDFFYRLNIRDWKLDIFQILQGSLGGSSEGESDGGGADGGMGDMISQQMEKILGKELFKVAHVEVSWTEGAKREWVEFTYLLTNQKKVDEVLVTLKPTYDKYMRSQNPNARGKGRDKRGSKKRGGNNKNPENPSGENPAPGTNPNEANPEG